MKKFFRLLAYIKPYKFRAGMNVVFNISSAIFALFSFTLIIPFLGILFGTQALVNEPVPFSLSSTWFTHNFNYLISKLIITHGKHTALLLVTLLVVSTTLLKNGLRFLANYHMAPLRTGIMHDMRNKVYDKILRLPISYFNESRKGDILTRISTDVLEIEVSIMSSLELLFRDPITIIIFLGFLLATSVKLTLFTFVLLPISGLVIGRIAKKLRATSKKGQKRLGVITSIVDETLTGLRVIKAFNAETKMSKVFRNANKIFTMYMNKIHRRHYLANPVSEFLGTVVMMILMYYGGIIVLSGSAELSPEQFMAYLVVFSQVITPAKAFSTAYFNIQKGMASADRVNEILDADIKIFEKENASPIGEFRDKIEFRNVSFKYEKEFVLKNINLIIEKGKTIAIVGRSGSGKSTLVDLIPRFMDVSEGEILIDGISLMDYKIKDLRNLMGVVSQQSILFNDSFFNNIAFGMNNVKEEDVELAARSANAHEFIENSQLGYFRNIGEGGNKLSGGQRQRITIARALLKNPPILILDEATSALDTESESLVQEAIINLMKNRTSIVIAHRLSTIKHADEIIVLEEGEIVERGKHEELLEMNGIYKKLHEMQMF